jgi:hypothetical protein
MCRNELCEGGAAGGSDVGGGRMGGGCVRGCVGGLVWALTGLTAERASVCQIALHRLADMLGRERVPRRLVT